MPQYPNGLFVGTDWIDKSVQATGTPDISSAELIRRDDALEAHDQGLYDLSRMVGWTVRAATTANVTTSGLQTVDGITLVAGDRVLVKNQTNAVQNGVYVASALTWARATDADEAADYQPGRRVFVQAGTLNGKTRWFVADPVTVLGSSNVNFAEDVISVNGQVGPVLVDGLAPLAQSEVSVSAATTLTSTAFGRQHVLSGSSYNLILPTATGNGGKSIRLRAAAGLTGAVTVLASDGTTRIVVLRAGDSYILYTDGTLWPILGRTLGVNPFLQLDYRPATDIANSVSMTANAWTNLGALNSFTVDHATSRVEFSVGGAALVQVGPTAQTNMGVRIQLDGATNHWLGGDQNNGNSKNALTGLSPLKLTGLTPGSHTVRVQVLSSLAATLLCRPASLPSTEGLIVQVSEYK